jgi:GNAT superfamily N-acetyltransferase
MEIKKITANKNSFMDLLLLADESENMVNKYLDRGELLALYDNDLKTAAVVTKEDENVYELKNIATYEKYRGKGYGSSMIKYIVESYKSKGGLLLVGTGEDERILTFYKKFGFEYSHTVKNFFVDSYDHKMFANGKQLKDMICLKMELAC